MHRRTLLHAALAPLLRAQPSRRPPNLVLIYADDLGYEDLGCYGSPLRTPHLDRMAAEGMRFTHCTSANPVCSPSRAALLTGRYPTRVGVPVVLGPQATGGLAKDEPTLAELLKPAGYETQCVGKWHLGHLPEYLPTRRGFDRYFGIPYSNDMNPPMLMRDQEVMEREARQDTLTQRYTEEATGFLQRSREKPFFLYFPHTFPHIPLHASARFRGKSPHGLYGDVVAELDWSVGEVLGTLKRLGLEDNTLVLFSSDNGPWYQGSPGRLRGHKGMTWEGGVRVPLLARWPGRVSAGKVCESLVSTMDVVPTFTKLAGVARPGKPVDGVDILPLLRGQREEREREALLYFDNVHLQCARRGPWKLHVSRYNGVRWSPPPPGGLVNLPLGQPELYHLGNDPSERYDVAPEHPEVVRDLQARIERLMTTFPEPIQQARRETLARPTLGSPVGQVPRATPQPN